MREFRIITCRVALLFDNCANVSIGLRWNIVNSSAPCCNSEWMHLMIFFIFVFMNIYFKRCQIIKKKFNSGHYSDGNGKSSPQIYNYSWIVQCRKKNILHHTINFRFIPMNFECMRSSLNLSELCVFVYNPHPRTRAAMFVIQWPSEISLTFHYQCVRFCGHSLSHSQLYSYWTHRQHLNRTILYSIAKNIIPKRKVELKPLGTKLAEHKYLFIY